MNNINDIFQNYLSKHADDTLIDFSPLLKTHPDLKDPLEKKIAAYQKIIGAFQDTPKEDKSTSLVGREIGGCKLLKIIGQGGMGIVYLGHQAKLNRDVVIKILRPFAVDNQVLKERFLRESRIIGRLNHKNIVPIYDVGEEDSAFYIIMKHLDGVPLNSLIQKLSETTRDTLKIRDILDVINTSISGSNLLREFRSPTEFFCNMVIQIGEAVQYAHDNGVIHRDIKSSNIIVEPNGNPVLLDFGLSHDEIEQNLTLSGDFLGTPIYSAPELFSRKPPRSSPQLDVYSLGVTLYEALTGGLPYDGQSIYEIYANIRTKEPVHPRSRWSGIPRDLETVITTAIAKEVPLRYPAVSNLCRDLYNFLHFQPITAKAPSSIRRVFYFAKRNKRLTAAIFLVLAMLCTLTYSTLVSQKFKKAKIQNMIYEGLTMLQRGNRTRARNLFEEVLKIDPQNTKALIEHMHMKMMDGEDPNKLLLEVKAALEKKPGDLNLLDLLAAVYIELNDYKQAREIADQILSLAPDHYYAYLVLSDAIISHGENLEEGMSLVRKFNALYPDEPMLSGLLATKCINKKNYDCAFEFFEYAVERKPDSYTKLLAGTYILKGDYKTAVDTYFKALEYSPVDADIHNSLATWLAKLERFDEALIHARKAVVLAPKNEGYKFTLNILQRGSKINWLDYKKRGIDLLQAEKYSEAVEVLKKALIFNDQDDDLYAFIGYGLVRSGHLEDSLEYLEKAFKMKPNNEGVKKIIDSVKAHLQALGIDISSQQKVIRPADRN